MVSKVLLGVWAVLDVCLLAAGVVAIAMSVVWRSPNILLNMVFSDSYLNAGLVLGIALLVTFFISIVAILQRNRVTIGLVLLNWTLIIDALGIVVVGTFIWFMTLRERDNFHRVFAEQTPIHRIAIQDKLKCCGYFNSSDLVEIGGNFCVDADFVNNVNNATCVTPITAFADNALMDVFTTIYAFMGIISGLFLASLCVINKRLEDERFKKIDEKRGENGFV